MLAIVFYDVSYPYSKVSRMWLISDIKPARAIKEEPIKIKISDRLNMIFLSFGNCLKLKLK